jgi:hypothetical protein
MSSLWAALAAFLAWLSSDPAAINVEAPRAAAAVAAAYAAFAPEAPPPQPETQPPAPPKAAAVPCHDGRCPTTGASPAFARPFPR